MAIPAKKKQQPGRPPSVEPPAYAPPPPPQHGFADPPPPVRTPGQGTNAPRPAPALGGAQNAMVEPGPKPKSPVGPAAPGSWDEFLAGARVRDPNQYGQPGYDPNDFSDFDAFAAGQGWTADERRARFQEYHQKTNPWAHKSSGVWTGADAQDGDAAMQLGSRWGMGAAAAMRDGTFNPEDWGGPLDRYSVLTANGLHVQADDGSWIPLEQWRAGMREGGIADLDTANDDPFWLRQQGGAISTPDAPVAPSTSGFPTMGGRPMSVDEGVLPPGFPDGVPGPEQPTTPTPGGPGDVDPQEPTPPDPIYDPWKNAPDGYDDGSGDSEEPEGGRSGDTPPIKPPGIDIDGFDPGGPQGPPGLDIPPLRDTMDLPDFEDIFDTGEDVLKGRIEAYGADRMREIEEYMARRGTVGSSIEADAVRNLQADMNQQYLSGQLDLLRERLGFAQADRQFALQERALELQKLGMDRDEAYRYAAMEADMKVQQYAFQLQKLGMDRDEAYRYAALSEDSRFREMALRFQQRGMDLDEAYRWAELRWRQETTEKGIEQDWILNLLPYLDEDEIEELIGQGVFTRDQLQKYQNDPQQQRKRFWEKYRGDLFDLIGDMRDMSDDAFKKKYGHSKSWVLGREEA